MAIRSINKFNGEPVRTPVVTVAELAAQLQAMIDANQGDLPVFSCDGRARFPFTTVVPYTQSGYPEALLIRPQAHLHVEESDTKRWDASYYQRVNAEADAVREACGAFHP